MKRILFLDGGFHKKTKSTEFIIVMLRKYADVDVEYIDTLTLDEIKTIARKKYDATIFLQINPALYINYFNRHNVVFIPMYDTFSPSSWKDLLFLKDVKWICFSKSYLNVLKNKKIKAYYCQYFPSIKRSVSSALVQPSSFFFWQRREELDWNIIRKLLSEQHNCKVHIHNAMDPGNVFKKPSVEDETKFNISYSNWFDNKEDLEKLICQHLYYIAPRLSEGIGMSFLDAMSLGRIVIAPDAPTMNEYITHGENGYLYNPNDPKPLVFHGRQLQENVINSYMIGLELWKKSEKEFINFIFSPHKQFWKPTNLMILKKIIKPIYTLLKKGGF